MTRRPYLDQALHLYHQWLLTVPRETTKDELIANAAKFHPSLFAQVDSLGRSIVHIVASFGPEWALTHLPMKKLSPDHENGWNPAHRAAYFGNILALRTLYQVEHDLFDLTDHNGHTPIDILVAQSRHRSRITTYQRQEVILAKTGGTLQTWGQNQNYTCGAESESARRFPEKVAINLQHEIVYASFAKYHGMCLTDGGRVYSWGINQNGRLGYEGPTVQLKPKVISFNCLQLAYVNADFKVKHLSTSDHHSIFIGTCGRVLATGQNEQNQLGLGGDVKTTQTPKMSAQQKHLKGLNFRLGATGAVHSVLATEESLYVTGRNIGQFGSEIAPSYEYFTKVAAIDQIGRIQRLESSSGAIALFALKNEKSQEGDVWLMENGSTRKVLKVKKLVEMSVIGGRVFHRSADIDWRSQEPVLALLTLDKVLLWSPQWRQGKEIEFVQPPPNLLPISSLALFDHGTSVMLAANDGQCYVGTCSKNKNKKHHEFTKAELDQINKRADQDPFSVGGYLKKKLAERPQEGLLAFDLERIPGAARCNKVYAEANGRTFGLLTQMNQHIDDSGVDEVDALTKPEQVEATTLADDLIALQEQGLGCDHWIDNAFHVHSQIAANIESGHEYDEVKRQIHHAYETVDPDKLDKDLTLVCIDGVIKCSKLILMARSEYFAMMFGMTFAWSETADNSVTLDLFAAEVEAMVEFCSSGRLPNSIELISQLSICADRFLMASLSGLCQQELARILVHERCPKAAVKAFPFSLTYNSRYLARKCVHIIADHLAVLLETGYLDLLDEPDLEQMSTLYQTKIDHEAIRMRPDVEDIDFTSDLFDELAKAVEHSPRKRHKSTTSRVTPEKEVEVEVVPMTTTTTTKPKQRPKRISLSEFDEKTSLKTPPRENWTTSPKTPQTANRSLNDIMSEESAQVTTPSKKTNWGPNRRKQARGQDILRWEEEQVIEQAKRSPSSPWGSARPVQRGSPSWPSPAAQEQKTKKKPVKTATAPITPSTKTWSLVEIMENEQQTQAKLNERKSLATIEIEERALVELKQYYQMQFPTDTAITVVRM